MCNRFHAFTRCSIIFCSYFASSTSLRCRMLLVVLFFFPLSLFWCISIYHIFLHRTLNLKFNPFILKTKVFWPSKRTIMLLCYNNKWWIYSDGQNVLYIQTSWMFFFLRYGRDDSKTKSIEHGANHCVLKIQLDVCRTSNHNMSRVKVHAFQLDYLR